MKHTDPSGVAIPGVEEARAALPSGRNLEAIEQLVKLAAALFDCRSAILLFNQAGISRAVCGHRIEAHHMSYRWSYAEAPYRPDERYVAANAFDNEVIQTRSPFAAGKRIGFFLRTPVEVAGDHTFTLIIYDGAAKNEPGASDLRLLDEIVKLIQEEIADIAPLMADPEAHVSVALSLRDLEARIAQHTAGAALFDEGMKLVAINPALEALLGRGRADLLGLTPNEITPRYAGALSLCFERAFAEKVSSPAVEISVEDSLLGAVRTFAVMATPFSPMDTKAYFLLVTVTDITARRTRETDVEDDVPARMSEPSAKPEPSAIFLDETLVSRRTIRSRNTISYITVRTWRSALKKYQIGALKALKQSVPASFADLIAREIGESVTSLVGGAAFTAIVPMPCGHSQPGVCLSLEIARTLGARLGLPVVQALACAPLKGSSHPKSNVSRPPMQLVAPVAGPVLLVDDVATSGAHLEEAAGLLKEKSRSVLPVAWIGGETK